VAKCRNALPGRPYSFSCEKCCAYAEAQCSVSTRGYGIEFMSKNNRVICQVRKRTTATPGEQDETSCRATAAQTEKKRRIVIFRLASNPRPPTIPAQFNNLSPLGMITTAGPAGSWPTTPGAKAPNPTILRFRREVDHRPAG